MTRKKFSPKFKTQVALEAIKNEGTLAELSKKYEIHPSQVQTWKASLTLILESAFSKGNSTVNNDTKQLAELERKIGQLVIENDFLKKNWVKYTKKNG
jgi:transposase